MLFKHYLRCLLLYYRAMCPRKNQLIKCNLSMLMQGGTLKIDIDSEWNIRMTGEVREIARGVIGNELIEDIDKTITN